MWNTIEIGFEELLDHVMIGVVNGLLELIHRKETRSGVAYDVFPWDRNALSWTLEE